MIQRSSDQAKSAPDCRKARKLSADGEERRSQAAAESVLGVLGTFSIIKIYVPRGGPGFGDLLTAQLALGLQPVGFRVAR